MAAREASLRRELRLPTTLIERVATTSPKPPSPRTQRASQKKSLSRPARKNSSRPKKTKRGSR
jgi:hypothetical protein